MRWSKDDPVNYPTVYYGFSNRAPNGKIMFDPWFTMGHPMAWSLAYSMTQDVVRSMS